MTLEVLYFAALRDLTGAASETIAAPAWVVTVGDLSRHLAERHSGMALNSVRFACNERFVDPSHRLSEGDTVALIPPVSGG